MKKALVTGGTKGIGLAIVKMLLKEGYFVTLTYAHDEEATMHCKLSLLSLSDNFEILKVDQANKKDVQFLIAHLHHNCELNCIVFNAGMTLRKGLNDFSDDEWERVMQVNVNVPTYMVRDLYDLIPHNSRIIFIGSEMGVLPHGTSLAYGVTKSAVHALALNLVKFFEGTGTTINAIAPGFVETEWQKEKPQRIHDSICNKTALKRFATVEEIADAVKFCLNNAFVNGSIIEVNGGYCYK